MERNQILVSSQVSDWTGTNRPKREPGTFLTPGKVVTNGMLVNLNASDPISYSFRNFVSAKVYSVYGAALRSSNYTVQYSDDNSNWTTAWTGVASNNTSCGIQQNTGSGNGSYGSHRYWRYVEGSAVVGHHPRVSRVILTDINGIDVNLVVYTVDNCGDSGTFSVGTITFDSALTWYDTSGSSLNFTGSSAITGNALQANQPYNSMNSNILNTNEHSMFFSIQINNTTGTWDKIFGYTPSSTDRSPGIWRWPSTARLHWRYDSGNSGADFDVTTVGGYNEPTGTQFQPNTWYYVGVTKNGATATSYVNGQKIGTSSVTNPKTPGYSTLQLYPGYTQNTSKMRHFHLYGRVLTDAEVLHNYNAIVSSLV